MRQTAKLSGGAVITVSLGALVSTTSLAYGHGDGGIGGGGHGGGYHGGYCGGYGKYWYGGWGGYP
jgi:hypothetical protein